MLIVFESLLPVFLLVAVGLGLKKARIIPDEHWSGMERFSFFVLFPAFLMVTMYRTDFNALPISSLTATFALGITTILIIGLILYVPVTRVVGISGPAYSSLYQGFGRWNAFIALPIVDAFFGQTGLAVVALAIVVMVIPINFGSILAVTWLGEGRQKQVSFLRQIITNPLIIGSMIGLLLNVAGIPLYTPVETTLELLARATLPIGLVLVGAGLKVRLPRSSMTAAAISSIIKLLGIPALFVGLGIGFGITGDELVILAICGSVPSAMAGYLLAREMGGDAPLYAGIITLQTIVSFFTIPLAISVAKSLAY